MKILFINTYFWPDMVGGTEKLLLDICKGLVKEHKVSILSLGNKTESFVHEGIEIYKIANGYSLFPKSIFQKIKNKYIDTFGSKKSDIRKIISDISPDVVHTNGLPGFSSYIYKIAGKMGIPIVDTIHDYWKYSLNGEENSVHSVINFVHHKCFKRNTKYVSCVTAPTSFMLKYIAPLKYYKNAKIDVVPNGTNVSKDEFLKILEKRVDKKYGDIHFLFVGQTLRKKGIVELVDAFNIVSKDKNIWLDICGTGELSNFVTNSSIGNNKIIYHGKLSSEDLLSLYLKSDVVVVPSIWNEPFGLVSIEAFSKALLVIGSNYGGVGEVLRKLEMETFNPADVNEFYSILSKYSNPDFLSNEYSNYIKRINIINYFSIGNTVERYLDIYKKLCDRK